MHSIKTHPYILIVKQRDPSVLRHAAEFQTYCSKLLDFTQHFYRDIVNVKVFVLLNLNLIILFDIGCFEIEIFILMIYSQILFYLLPEFSVIK